MGKHSMARKPKKNKKEPLQMTELQKAQIENTIDNYVNDKCMRSVSKWMLSTYLVLIEKFRFSREMVEKFSDYTMGAGWLYLEANEADAENGDTKTEDELMSQMYEKISKYMGNEWAENHFGEPITS